MELEREKAKREAVEEYKEKLKKELRECAGLIVAVLALLVAIAAYLRPLG